jgi:predicted nucleic acid-binding protein
LLSARDQHHAEADAAFRRAVRDRVRLVTTSLVLAEVHRLLLFRAGIRAAALALDRIADSEHVDLVYPGAAEHQAAKSWIQRLDDQRLTYTDAVSFAVMKSKKCDAVLGFDHDFLVAGFRFWREK